MSTAVIIPARLGSQRLPGKPLKVLGELPLVIHVYRQVSQCRGVDVIAIATDSEEVAREAKRHGATAVMTRGNHPSGTDRVAEAAHQLDAQWVVNVQGDEPFIDPADVQTVIDATRESKTDLVTLRYPIEREEDLHNPNIVKVVCRKDGQALYFSRSPLPFSRDTGFQQGQHYRHIGVYGYKHEALTTLTQTPVHPLEDLEKLEQLRALAHGMTIGVYNARTLSRGIDTIEDLTWAQQHITRLGKAAFPSGQTQ